MHGSIRSLVERDRQAARAPSPINFKSSLEKYADETPKQRADHREIDRRYRKKKRRGPKTYRRICELEIVFVDQYGAVLPDDDAGTDSVFVMANHLAHLDKPGQRIKAFVQRRAPWYGQRRTAKLIKTVLRKPLKWTADKLAQRIGLDYATRTRLGITTIGATDCGKTKRTNLRRKRNNDMKRLKRAQAGATPRALSEARLKPWLALGISESTYRRRKRRDSNSGTACAKDIIRGDESLSPDRRAAASRRLSARGASSVGRGYSHLCGDSLSG
jgi:hypothetical protein